ncbi:MAG TPA: sigma-70 family RNA polymerase sigma factor [Puia sp.]|jgi:RNA polymerase sigma factor (sigma-70 family)|nr:sigma-70 family RNA polymerase sigma factor [Puia sp.]
MFYKRKNIPENDLQQLIDGCLAGERSRQKQLYEHYSPKMLALCLRYADNQEEAEEILQDGFLQMFRNIRQYRQIGTFEGWLRKIMINCALMRYRSNNKLSRIIVLSEDHDHITTADDFLDRLGEKELILQVQKLPPAYRLVFNLYVFEGIKHKEIAHLLHISEGTSKSNLSDARAILKRALTGNYRVAK